MRQATIKPISEYHMDVEFSYLGLEILFRCLLNTGGNFRTYAWREKALKELREARWR